MKTIKHLLILCAAVVLLATLLVGCGDKESSGLEFVLFNYGEGYVVVGIGSCKDKKIVIPAEHEGKPVIWIGSSAFEGCTGLTSITIPDSVTSIGSSAFWGCTGLTSIIVADGNSVYHSDGNCLIETGRMILITGCKNSIIPTDGSVTSIGSYAFEGCTGLTSITIPDSVTSIGGSAFSGCTGLTSITIPDSVTSIGGSAFSGCTGLTSITVADGNSVYHSDGNCLIETGRMILITGCKNSIIPTDGSVTEIGWSAFEGCTGLESITIPDSVTEIGKYAFYGCTGLTSVTFTGTKAQWKAIEKGDDWKVETGSFTVHCTDGNISYSGA